MAIDENMLTSKPPHPSQPNAALMALMGRRCFGTPEVEDGLKLMSAWLKKLADPSTQWGGKEPYGVSMRSGMLFQYYGTIGDAPIQVKIDGKVQMRTYQGPRPNRHRS